MSELLLKINNMPPSALIEELDRILEQAIANAEVTLKTKPVQVCHRAPSSPPQCARIIRVCVCMCAVRACVQSAVALRKGLDGFVELLEKNVLNFVQVRVRVCILCALCVCKCSCVCENLSPH